jgi:hemerythrin-like domain-containing protein
MDAIRILQDEHRTFGALLHALRHLVREMRDHGAAPRFELLGAIVYFMDTYSERIHHPRESEYLFPRLRARCPAAAPTLDILEAEHRAGDREIRALEQALTRYRHGGAAEFAAFAAAAESYAEHQQQHMRREEREILPLAREYLRPADWDTIDRAFAGNAVPAFDEDAAASYRTIFSRIVAMAPPPIGVGPD